MNPSFVLALYFLLVAAPAVAMMATGAADGTSMRTFAIGAGMLGLAALFMQFLSSGRYEAVSGRAGMDRIMRFHQLAARALTVLVILHPVLFLMPRSIAELPELPGSLFSMLGMPYLRSGTIAWLALLALMVMAMMRGRLPISYEHWRASHAVMAAIAAAAGLHHALAVGAYSASPWLAGYWWTLGTLAFGTLAYLYLVKPLLLARRAYRVLSNREIGTGIREIVLEPGRGKPLKFQAGQFGWVLLDQPPITLLDHPFSFSSAPSALPEVRLLIKARGDFTGRLGAVRPGAVAYVDGPYGNFTFHRRHGSTVAFIAGGIGIAPVMSLLRHLRDTADRRPIGLLYGARKPSQLVHADEIRDTARALDLRCSFFVDEPPADWDGGVGELTLAAIRATLRGDPQTCLCFLCGPTPMMLACRERLLACGVPPDQIVFERFDYD